MVDRPSGHAPDRIEIELHTDPVNLAETIDFSMPPPAGSSGAQSPSAAETALAS